MTETETQMVEQIVHIDALPETVWHYWTDPARMGEWWGTARALDARPGGACQIEMAQGPVMEGEFVELVPHERLVFSFGWASTDGAPSVAPGSTRVEVTLAADAGGTLLTLRHFGLPAPHADEHHAGWGHFLGVLADTAAGSQDR